MKVLHLGKYYPPYPGGIETYTRLICEGLAQRGLNIDLVASNNEDRFVNEYRNGVKVFRLPRKRVLSSIPICPSMPPFLRKLIKRNNYDILHLHFPNPMAESSLLLCNFKSKLVITYHTDIGFKYKIKKLYIPFVHHILRRADKIIATSENFLLSSLFLKNYLEKSVVIPISVGDFFLEDSNDGITKQIIEKFGDFILFVGNLSSYKGPEYLIKAMKSINANLVIIGVGLEEKRLKDEVMRRGLEKKVFFLGKIENDQLINYYDACKIFCLPSVSPAETFGIVLLEAMARSKPVISTELGTGTSWVNVDGETGFVVSPRSSEELSNAINKILCNDRLREQMGNNAKKRVIDNFTREKVIDYLIELYKN